MRKTLKELEAEAEIINGHLDITEKLIPEIALDDGSPMRLSAYCPVCKKKTEFIFRNHQTDRRNQRIFDLYNCSVCGDTVSFNQTEYWRNKYPNAK